MRYLPNHNREEMEKKEENKDLPYSHALGTTQTKLPGQLRYLSNVCGSSSVKHMLGFHLFLLQFEDFTGMRKLKCQSLFTVKQRALQLICSFI